VGISLYNRPFVSSAFGSLRRAAIERPWLFVVVAHGVQLLVLMWIAAHATFCCDASNYYLPAGHSLIHDGLLWQDSGAGYRFYLTPLTLGLLEKFAELAGVSPASLPTAMPFLLASCFFVTSSIASAFVLRRDGMRKWFLFAVPVFLNPLALSIAPYPIQESIVAIFGLPLLVVLLAHRFDNAVWRCVVGAALIATTIAARSTLAWLLVPVAVYVAQETFQQNITRKDVMKALVAAFAVMAILLAPQAYINWNTFHSLTPTTATKFGDDQIGYGVGMLNYSTVENHGTYGPLPVPSPYTSLSAAEKTSEFYVAHPVEGFFLVLVHTWSAFNYVAFIPYVPRSAIGLVTPALIVSALTVALGLLGLFQYLRTPPNINLAIFLILTVALSCAYVALSATENRFGLFGFVALSLSAWQLLASAEGRRLCVSCAPIVIAYVFLCVVINGLLFYRTSLFWPNAG
jgi:hypothetical protein